MSFNIALSGINAAQKDLDVTANNISNVNTYGFKESRAEFADVYSASVFSNAATTVGQGVTTKAVAQQFSQGVPLDKAFSQARPPIWDKRRPLVSKALQRLSAQRWAQLLQDAQRIDAQIKGQAEGSPWIGLARLSLLMAGQRLALPPE